MSLHSVVIHTDGSCLGNPGVGGIGYILSIPSIGHEKEVSQPFPGIYTNNSMELTAAVEALKALKKPCEVTLHSDSNYLIKGMTEWIEGWVKSGWRKADKKPVLNQELWLELLALSKKHTVTWVWVKGHSTDSFNIRVDKLANDAAHLAKSCSV